MKALSAHEDVNGCDLVDRDLPRRSARRTCDLIEFSLNDFLVEIV